MAPLEGSERAPASAQNTRWLWLSALVCPCHFPLIVLLALGGTALGALLRTHLVWLFGGDAVVFVAFLLAGLRTTGRAAVRGCPACVPGSVEEAAQTLPQREVS